MINKYLSERPLLRMVMLCGMYIAQGIPFGFVTITLVGYMTAADVSTSRIGLMVSIVTWPWSLKWAWGPLIDTVGIPSMGRRRPWILLAQSMMAVTLAAMILIGDVTTAFAALTALVLLHNIFGSLQDVSVDALAVDMLTEQERGRVNGLMYASSYFGSFLGGFVLGQVVAKTNLRMAFIVQTVMLFGLMCLPLLLRERRGDKLLSRKIGYQSGAKSQSSSFTASLKHSLSQLKVGFSVPASILAAAVALYSRFGTGVVTVIVPNQLIQQLSWTQEDYSKVMGGYGNVTGFTGAMLGGFIADAFGIKRTAITSTILVGLVWIGFALTPGLWESRAYVITVLCAQEFLVALMLVSLFSMFMSVSWPVVAATQFTAYMAMMNLSTSGGSLVSGYLEPHMSFGAMMIGIGLIQAALAGLIHLIDPGQTRQRLGDGSMPDSDPDADSASLPRSNDSSTKTSDETGPAESPPRTESSNPQDEDGVHG